MFVMARSSAQAIGTQSSELREASYPLASRMLVEVEVVGSGFVLQTNGASVYFPGGGAGGALVGAFASAGSQYFQRKGANKAIAPLADALGDLPIAQTAVETVEAHLDRELFAKELDVQVVALEPGESRKYRDLPPARRVLVLETFFGFGAEARLLKVRFVITIEGRYKVDKRTRVSKQLVLFTEYAYSDPAVDVAKTRDERLAIWQERLDREFGLRLLREAMRGAIEQVNESVRTRNDKPPREPRVEYADWSGSSVLLREIGGRRWMRPPNRSALVSVGPLPARQPSVESQTEH